MARTKKTGGNKVTEKERFLFERILYIFKMKNWIYLFSFIIITLFVSGCLDSSNTDLYAPTILYACSSLEGANLENGKFISNNGNSCIFTLQEPTPGLPYYLENQQKIQNVKNEIAIEPECKETLQLPEIARIIINDSENQLYGCIPVSGE